MLQIRPQKVAFIIAKSMQFDAADVMTEPNPGSNPTDDGMIEILEDHKDNATLTELWDSIRGLNDAEKIDLIALTWFGRDGDSADEFEGFRQDAREFENPDLTAYLGRMPLLANYLETALSMLGYDVAGLEREAY